MSLEQIIKHNIERIKNLDFGLYNLKYSGSDSNRLQIGLINGAEGLSNISQLGVLNVAAKASNLSQLGTFNFIDEDSNAIQLGLFNISLEKLIGIQAGLICIANEGHYLQLGLLTIRGTGPWYSRITPGIGYHRTCK